MKKTRVPLSICPRALKQDTHKVTKQFENKFNQTDAAVMAG